MTRKINPILVCGSLTVDLDSLSAKTKEELFQAIEQVMIDKGLITRDGEHYIVNKEKLKSLKGK